jgi:hypothetical protein
MQPQRSSSGVGGKAEAARQALPTVGQDDGTVFVGEYWSIWTPEGVTAAIWLERAVKSFNLLAVSPLTETRPSKVSVGD